jgi:citrate lyase beta subunit
MPSRDHLADLLEDLDGWLAPADAQAALFAGDRADRQPVHTVYVPADRYRPDLPSRYGAFALRLLAEHGPADDMLTAAGPGTEVMDRVRAKLERQPVEDLRVDFEDGYGLRPDDEEDAAAVATGQSLATSAGAAGAPFVCGIRVKGLQPSTRRRAVRTLDRVIAAAVGAGGLPPRFVVTLPKITHVAEVEAAVRLCERLEQQYGLAPGALRFELQIEVPQAVVGPDGVATVARLVHAAAGRCEGLHYGTYDFSAAVGVTAALQSLTHPLADHAKAVMQLAAAGTGVRISDGSTNVVPAGETTEIRHAWTLHGGLVLRALRLGIYQGWDLHPGHLPTRFAATYAFLRGELALSGERLLAYTARTASGVLEEPATGEALARGVLRGLDCGAYDEVAAREVTGLDRAGLERLVRREA